MAYTPIEPKYKIYLAKNLDPMTDVCHRGVLLHELIHVLQEDQNIFVDYDERTKKHLREMDALVNHNIYLSRFGKKFFTATVLQQNLKRTKRIHYIVNSLNFLRLHHNQYNQRKSRH